MNASPQRRWRRAVSAAGLLVAAWLTSLALAFLYAILVPRTEYVPPGHEYPPAWNESLRPTTSFSERVDEIIEPGQDAVRAQIAREEFGGSPSPVRQHVLAITWIPWVLLALWLRPSRPELFVVVGGLVALLIVGILSPTEAVLFALAAVLTLVAKSSMRDDSGKNAL